LIIFWKLVSLEVTIFIDGVAIPKVIFTNLWLLLVLGSTSQQGCQKILKTVKYRTTNFSERIEIFLVIWIKLINNWTRVSGLSQKMAELMKNREYSVLNFHSLFIICFIKKTLYIDLSVKGTAV
jgi:hypothetical protein